jgi:hypothetical protein
MGMSEKVGPRNISAGSGFAYGAGAQQSGGEGNALLNVAD